MIRAVMAEIELVGFAAERQAEQLMPQTDPEHGLLAKNARDGSVSVRERGRIAGSVRQKHAVGVVRKNLCGGRVSRQHLYSKAGRNQTAQDVQLDPVVERDNLRRVA